MFIIPIQTIVKVIRSFISISNFWYNSIQNFIAAIGYTLHFNEDLHLEKDELASFMDDLFVSVDLFRSGEYNPEDYTDQLKEDGIILSKYNYSKIFDNLGKNISTELKEIIQ